MTTHGRGASRLVFGSVTDAVLRSANLHVGLNSRHAVVLEPFADFRKFRSSSLGGVRRGRIVPRHIAHRKNNLWNNRGDWLNDPQQNQPRIKGASEIGCRSEDDFRQRRAVESDEHWLH